MAVIGSRANGTRVPGDAVKGGGFGPASRSPQTGLSSADAFQPASERRDVTFLGRPMLPAAPEPAPGPGSGASFEANNLADIDLPPLDARSDLFVKSTLDRTRREWFDTVAQDERALDPLAATGFAGGITQRFGDFTAKTLADTPDALRPHIAGGLERVGREIETRAADFEDVPGKVGVFNQTKQALDDISATTAHERFDAQRLLIEGPKRIQDAPLNEGSRAILSDYFLADLPVKAALSHINDDPDDALAALKSAQGANGKANGDGRGNDRTKRSAGSDAPAPDGLADGADGDDGQFDPATFYAGIAPEVHSGLMAKARITSLRRREGARITTTKSLEQGIAANTVTPGQIEASVLGTDDKVRLQAQLVAARIEDTLNADAAERFVTNPQSLDPNNPADRAMADRGFRTIAGETDKPASALSVGQDGEVVDVIDLAARFTRDAGFMPDAAIERLRHIASNGSREDRQRAAMILEEFNIPRTEGAIPSELVGETEMPASPTPPQPLPEDQPNTSPETPVEGPQVEPEEFGVDVSAPETSVDENGPANLDPEPGNNTDVVLDEDAIAKIRNSLKDPEAFQSKFQRAIDKSEFIFVPFRALSRFGSLIDGPVIVGRDADGNGFTLVDRFGRAIYLDALSNRYFFADPSNPRDLTMIETANDLAGSISPSGLALGAKAPKGALTMGAARRGSGGSGKSVQMPSSAERASKMEAMEVGQDKGNLLALVHPSDVRTYPDVRTTIILDRPVMMSKEVAQRGYPLGFNSADEFLAYKKGLLDALPARHGDAVVGMRGSSIHGKKFKRFDDLPNEFPTSDNKVQGAHIGPFFDTGKEPSDWDIFIVSPELFRIAKEKHFLRRENSKSTRPIEKMNDFRKLGLERLGSALRNNVKRKSSIMIFESLDGLRRRGSYMQFE